MGELKTRKAAIETQLGDLNRTDPDTGQRLSAHEWNAWRSRAKSAIQHCQEELDFLKAWEREHPPPKRVREKREHYAVLDEAYGYVRTLDHVFRAAVTWADDPSPANEDALRAAVARARGGE